MAPVLIIDDSDTERRSLAELVRSEGFDVIEGASVREARELIEGPASDFALLLCDHVLPDGRGSELLDELAVHRPDLPATLVTGSVGAPELEGRDLIAKPIRISQLMERLDSVRRALH